MLRDTTPQEILQAVRAECRDLGWNEEAVATLLERATSGDYAQLVDCVEEHFTLRVVARPANAWSFST
jgi:hypothetical protein